MPVKMGIGKNKIAISVMRFRGIEERYIEMMSVQCPDFGIGTAKAAPGGRHWKIVKSPNARPPALTTTKVPMQHHLKILFCVGRVK
jgi:hypothetical protein